MRSWRLLLPLVFGMLVVVPIQPYAEGVANGLVQPGFLAFLARYYAAPTWPEGAFAGWEHGFTWNHLWYLAYLWSYTLVFARCCRCCAACRIRSRSCAASGC